jgi:outer membrane lipoprotein SlyB
MARYKAVLATCSLLALGACAVPPPQGPSVVAMPGPGKSYQAFQQEDAYCRQAAFASTGGVDANTAATQSAVGSAVVGTAVGAAAGALIGAAAGNPGAGAAIGAGAGLITGSAAGAGNAQLSGAQVQGRYDQTYAQCMFAQGNTVSQPQPNYAAAPGYWGGPAVVAAPVFVAPPVVVGGPVWVGGGWGYRGGWGGYRGGYWR